MRKRYIFIAVLLFFFATSLFFGNIIYAFVAQSESIDSQTFKVILQGRFSPTKEINFTINNNPYNIPLPKGSGELTKYEYLAPTSSWNSYKDSLTKTDWTDFNQTGTLVSVKNSNGDKFNISVRPFTGAYMILKYTPAEI